MPYIALDDIMPSGPAALGHYIASVQLYGMLHSGWAITNTCKTLKVWG